MKIYNLIIYISYRRVSFDLTGHLEAGVRMESPQLSRGATGATVRSIREIGADWCGDSHHEQGWLVVWLPFLSETKQQCFKRGGILAYLIWLVVWNILYCPIYWE